jgi:asparagine synthase (glutamine-hydrolysing)
MCGILTVINKKGHPLDILSCQRALSFLTPRGPDLSCWEMVNENFFFGQTILSITGNIDDGSHLESESGQYRLVLNGEIYNYSDLLNRYLDNNVFTKKDSGTDSQVLVNLHDVMEMRQIPSVLDGMYAYVVWDKKNNVLAIARDPQGEKSLYVFEDAERIIISSEISPILSLVPQEKFNVQRLRDYFHTRHLMFLESTIYPHIRQLLPGSLEIYDLINRKRTFKQRRDLADLIDPDRMLANKDRTMDDLVDECDEVLARCIKEMLPLERKYASVLSGGVDSSLITHYVCKYGSPEFLVAVNHVGKDRISSNLEPFKKYFSQTIKVLDVDPFSYGQEISRCQRVCRSPLMSHSFIGQSIQSAYVRSQGCRVLFGGDGADEYFGGYGCYHMEELPKDDLSPSFYTRYYETSFCFVENINSGYREELVSAWEKALAAYRHIPDERERICHAMMFCDATWQLPSVGLRGSDLMSLMWAVETRSPFIRLPLIQFALNLPLFCKSIQDNGSVPLWRAKPILKKLFARYFSEELLFEKQGFAGFPNESAALIGEPRSYLAFDVLGISHADEEIIVQNRDLLWKLINVEYFLRFVAN